MAGLTGWHFLIVLVVVLLLFGARKLPELAKGLGESMRVFKSEVKKTDAPSDKSTPPTTTTSSTSESSEAPDTLPKP